MARHFFMTPSEEKFLKVLQTIPLNPREGELILFADKIKEEYKSGNYESRCIKNKIIPGSRAISSGKNFDVFFGNDSENFKRFHSGWRVNKYSLTFDRGDYVKFEFFPYKDILYYAVPPLIGEGYSILEGKLIMEGRINGHNEFISSCELNLSFRPNENYFSLCLEIGSLDREKTKKMKNWFKEISKNTYYAKNKADSFYIEPLNNIKSN